MTARTVASSRPPEHRRTAPHRRPETLIALASFLALAAFVAAAAADAAFAPPAPRRVSRAPAAAVAGRSPPRPPPPPPSFVADRSPSPADRARLRSRRRRTTAMRARFEAGGSSAAAAAAATGSTDAAGGGALSSGGAMLSSVLSGLLPSPEKFRAVGRAVSEAVDVGELIPLALLGLGAVPLARAFHALFSSEDEREAEADGKEGGGGGGGGFEGTYLYEAADHVSQAARIGGLVFAAHASLVSLDALGVRWARRRDWLSRAAARAAYTVWIASRVRYFKRRLIARAVHSGGGGDDDEPDELGRARVYDRMLDYVVYAAAAFFLLDAFKVPTGRGLQSIFAVGGVGSLVFGLACRELAAQLVSGLALSAGQKFFDGDTILLGDGTQGKVCKVGAMETEIRGFDEVVTRIPNTQIVNQRVSNLSRLTMSQVKQTLRFSHADIKKLPIVLHEIKYEIQRSCPRLVTDGSRPFRAHWRDFTEDGVECVVQCHFKIRPSGDEYWDNRQTMLQAIARAAEKRGVEFAVPMRHSRSEDVTPGRKEEGFDMPVYRSEDVTPGRKEGEFDMPVYRSTNEDIDMEEEGRQ